MGLVLGIAALILAAVPGVAFAADPPVFDAPPTPLFGATLVVGVGESLEFTVRATDADVLAAITQLDAGAHHNCVLLDTGAVRCWGRGGDGRLGYGNTSAIGDNETPASAGDVDVGGTVVQISTGLEHSCVVLDTGAVRCWGLGADGRLGYGNTTTIGDNETPADVGEVAVGGTVAQIAPGSFHTCALLTGGAVRCWGAGSFGQLGYGNTDDIGDNETPADAGDVAVGGTVTQIATGAFHTCALLDSGAVRCWGAGSSGRLGYANTDNVGDNETPADVGDVAVGGTVTQIVAGDSHTCALLTGGGVRCWGAGGNGKLGYSSTSNIGDNETPASAGDVNVGGTVVQISAGRTHTCALMATGAVRCWGDGPSGQLGYGNTNDIGDNETPATAGDVNVGGTVAQLRAGGAFHTCALLDSGAVRCWGTGTEGRLGYGNTTAIGDDEAPALAGDVDIVDPGDVVSLGVVGLPAGAGFSPGAAANPVSATFTWVPTNANVGSHAVTFTAQDQTALTATPHAITIEVTAAVVPVPGVAPWALVGLAGLLAVAFLWGSRRLSWRPQRSAQ